MGTAKLPWAVQVWCCGSMVILAGSLVGGWALPGAAQERSPLGEKSIQPKTQNRPSTTVKEWMAQIEADTIQVTDIQLNSTDGGLDLVLQTPEGKRLSIDATQFRTEGNSLIADIPNAVLALPKGQSFATENPTADIAIIQVIQSDGGIRVSVTGKEALPQTAVTLKTGGLAYSLNSEKDEEEIVAKGDRSIEHAIAMLSQKIDRLDVLINNAGVYPDQQVDSLTISRELLNSAMQTNVFGVIQMVQVCLPLLEKSTDARIINVSSGMGAFDGLTTTAPSYSLSKLVLNGATVMLSQSLAAKNIVVNAICPGWVRTDMGGTSAPRSPEQGADTAIWLAMDAPRSHSGKFFRDRQVITF